MDVLQRAQIAWVAGRCILPYAPQGPTTACCLDHKAWT